MVQFGRGTYKTQSALIAAVLLATALLAYVLPQRSQGASTPSLPTATGSASDVIVRFAPSVRPAQRRAAVRAAGGVVTHDLHLIDGLGARMTPDAADRLRSAMGIRS